MKNSTDLLMSNISKKYEEDNVSKNHGIKANLSSLNNLEENQSLHSFQNIRRAFDNLTQSKVVQE